MLSREHTKKCLKVHKASNKKSLKDIYKIMVNPLSLFAFAN